MIDSQYACGSTDMVSFLLEMTTNIGCAVYKEVETGKEGQQLNCMKFKAIRSLSLVAGRNIHPDSKISVYSNSRKTRTKRGNKCMLFLVGIAVELNAYNNITGWKQS